MAAAAATGRRVERAAGQRGAAAGQRRVVGLGQQLAEVARQRRAGRRRPGARRRSGRRRRAARGRRPSRPSRGARPPRAASGARPASWRPARGRWPSTARLEVRSHLRFGVHQHGGDVPRGPVPQQRLIVTEPRGRLRHLSHRVSCAAEDGRRRSGPGGRPRRRARPSRRARGPPLAAAGLQRPHRAGGSRAAGVDPRARRAAGRRRVARHARAGAGRRRRRHARQRGDRHGPADVCAGSPRRRAARVPVGHPGAGARSTRSSARRW